MSKLIRMIIWYFLVYKSSVIECSPFSWPELLHHPHPHRCRQQVDCQPCCLHLKRGQYQEWNRIGKWRYHGKFLKVESLEDSRYSCESSTENNMATVDPLITMHHLCTKNPNIRFLNYWMINASFIIKHELNTAPTFLGHVTGGEESLLSVWQFSHPPVVVVFVQHRDNVTLEYRQLVRPLSSVIVHGYHLQDQTDIFNDCPLRIKEQIIKGSR